ncbi:MAG TPA: glycosyltransferase [Longimicrobiaceae bacterium]|nr:glycosyltransferase [Longimicrobiaceae bacterium]
MKICDLTQSYASTGGGVRTYIQAKRDQIVAKTDHEHLLIVPGPTDSVVREGRTVTCTIKSPFVPGSRVYRLLLRSDKVLRILETEKPDLVECQCTYNLPWTALKYRRRNPAVRVVGSYMTDVPNAYVRPIAERVLGKRGGARALALADDYIRRLYSRFDAAVAISPAFARRLTEMGIENVRSVPLGVDLQTFSPARRDPGLRRRRGIGDGDVLMIYCGRLDSEKRPGLLIDAFEHLPPDIAANLVMIGEGPLRGELTQRTAGNSRIRILPYEQDRTELARQLASSDIYVSAMPYETFGLSVIEAQACGLPVVGVAGGAMRDRVPADLGVGLLGPVDSVDDLARNMAEMARDPERVAVGRRARALVESEFSWDRTFSSMFELYAEIIGR